MARGDGAGFVNCRCGQRHWGRFGAAGLLLLRPGTGQVFLQLRAPWVHTPDTWATPGGALDSHETAVEGALREAHEENDVPGQDVAVAEVLRTTDHHDWSYDLVLATLTRGEPQAVSHESRDAGWFTPAQVPGLALHPGLRTSWPQAAAAVGRLLRRVPA